MKINKLIKQQEADIKNIVHKDGDGIRGACGNPCRACEKTDKLKAFLNKAITEIVTEVLDEAIGEKLYVQKGAQPDSIEGYNWKVKELIELKNKILKELL